MNRWLAPVAVSLGILLIGSFWLRGPISADAAPDTKKEKDKDKDKRTLFATGNGTVRTTPDSARLYVTLETIAPTVKEVREQNQAKFAKIRTALEGLKIPDLKMKTAEITLDPQYTTPKKDEAPRLTGYRIRNSFTVLMCNDKIQELNAHAGKVLDTLFENGVNTMQHIQFFKKEVDSLQREAMTKAVENALKNAKALAAGANVTIVETTNIQTAESYYPRGNTYYNVQSSNRAAEGDTTAVVAGELEITFNVQITCAY